MRSRYGRKVLAAASILVAALVFHSWLNRPRSLESITEEYYVRAGGLAAELESANNERGYEIVDELATYGSLAKPAVPSILDFVDRLEARDDTQSRSILTKVLRKLPRIGDPRFTRVYLDRLADEESTVSQRMGAWSQASEMGAAEIVEPMLRDLYHLFGDEVSVNVSMALQRVGRHDPDAILAAFVHPDDEVRRSALYAGGHLWFPEITARYLLDIVFSLLDEGDHPFTAELEYLAVSLTTNCEDERVDEAMRFRAGQLNSRVHREWIARYQKEPLKQRPDDMRTWEEESALRERVRDAALLAMDDPTGIRDHLHGDMRGTALAALRDHAARETAIREIRRLLDHEYTYFVLECIRTLGTLKAVEAVEELIRLAESQRHFFRGYAIRALTEIGDRRALPLFRTAIEEKAYADDAAKGLVAVAQPENRGDLESLVSNDSKIEPTAKLCILLYLDGLDGRSYRRELVDLAESVSKEEWLRFSLGLDQLSEAPNGDERLLDLLRSRNDRLASLAVRPLVARMGDDAIPHLRSVIPSAGEITTLEIIKALGWMDSPGAVDALIYIMERGNGRYKPASQLYEITGEKYGEIAEAWRAWYREQQSSP